MRVRARILFFCLIIAGVALVLFWAITFRSTHPGDTIQIFKDLGASATKTFTDPTYKSTFGTPPTQ